MQSASVNLFHREKRKIAHKQTSTALSEFIQKERALAATTDLSEAFDSSTDMPEVVRFTYTIDFSKEYTVN